LIWHFIFEFIFETVPKDHDVRLAVLDREGFHALEFPCRRSDNSDVSLSSSSSTRMAKALEHACESGQTRKVRPCGTPRAYFGLKPDIGYDGAPRAVAEDTSAANAS
jgi:hypothetical protein